MLELFSGEGRESKKHVVNAGIIQQVIAKHLAFR